MGSKMNWKKKDQRHDFYVPLHKTRQQKGGKTTRTHIMPRITCTGSPDGGGTVGCGTVLVHPPSASFVRCAVCSAITPCRPIVSGHDDDDEDVRGTIFPIPVSSSSSSSRGVAAAAGGGGFGGRFGVGSREMGAIQCRGCAVRLMFDLDATQVHCALCRTVNRVASGGFGGGSAQRQDVSHCQCRGCGVTLMYTRGATSVSCGACHAITNTAGIVAAGEGERWSKAGGVGEEERELVVVENPPVKLRDGRVMPNVSVAVEIHSNK